MSQCEQCGHKWKERAENPMCCPKCKRYNWRIKNDLQKMQEKGNHAK